MTAQLNRQIHALLNVLDVKALKPTIINSATGGRTASVTEMTDREGRQLVASLQAQETAELKPMRGKVIHLLCLLGYVDSRGQADYDRMNNYVADIGSNNPKRKVIFGLSKTELRAVLNQVEARYRNGEKAKAGATKPPTP